MSHLEEVLTFNKQFVQNHEYDRYRTSKFPNKKLVLLSCMDTRLSDLLPRAMNLENGDAKFIKNAGAVVSHPFGSTMRSILVAVYEQGAEEMWVVGHYGCGMTSIDPDKTFEKMTKFGIAPETIGILEHAGIDLRTWLQRIESIPDSVRDSVRMIRSHPLVPKTLLLHGLMIDPETGQLEVVFDGYQD